MKGASSHGSIGLRCFILVASCGLGTPQESFTIHSAVDASKCISVLHWRQLELHDCDNDLSESSQVWYWNQSWLVNRHFKYQGATQCVNFYDASFEYHGRPLRLNSCMEGMLSMDWIWEDGRIKHAHSAFCFDLPGRNFSDFAWYSNNVQSTTGLILQLGAIESLTDQTFILSPVPGTGRPPGFHPVASSPTQKTFVKASCPDGSFGERNLCPALHRPRDKSPCQGGRVQEICACPPGYYVHVFRKVLDGKWDYTCCFGEGGEGSEEKCGDWQFIGTVAVSMLALGIIGVVALTVALRRQKTIAPTTEDDRLLETPTIRNGARLHRTVHQSRWCVTLSDLQQFKRVVFQAVLKGVIQPTGRDQFLASDVRVGPSVYTVNEQFIKPMTRDAGNVSWALMKHPEGLQADVFITHAWAEGIYEFVDKVTHSWPRGATAAYVCFLSNPQNLDISDLIQSPRESPFAKALETSRFVIAVPNHACSIYSRIWCVYEAFLAYIWDKQILVAKSPEAIWLRMGRGSCIAIATLGACILVLMSQTTYYGFTASFLALVRQMRLVSFILSVLCGICILLFFVWEKHAWISCRIAIFVFAIFVEMFVAADLCLNGATDPPVICVVLLSILLCGAVEGDHQQRVEASRQTQALRQGFAGTVSKAQSSSLSDLQAILAEIDLHASVRKVDQTVETLLTLGLSRKELRQVTEHVGPLGDVSVWSKALFVSSSGLFVFQSFQVYRYRILTDASTLHYILLGVAVFEAILWPVIFLLLPVERKSFTTRCLPLPLLLLLSPQVVGLWGGFSYDAAAHFGVIPVVLLMALLGPARIAKIPVQGPAVIRMLFGRRPWTTTDRFTASEVYL